MIDNEGFNEKIKEIKEFLSSLGTDDLIDGINHVKIELNKISPLKNNPVDCVLWVKSSFVKSNDYNPNSVAPPEMQLLEVSIAEDGYTQPIVAWENNGEYEIVDGFHRNRVGKEAKDINDSIYNRLPVSIINNNKSEKGDRIASTIRHNRARGKHSVDAMTEIVVELKKRNWTKEKISKHLGMDSDEVLRLTQISGLVEMFKDEEFSKSWNIDIKEMYEDSEEESELDLIDEEN